jgi:hypothetical protein
MPKRRTVVPGFEKRVAVFSPNTGGTYMRGSSYLSGWYGEQLRDVIDELYAAFADATLSPSMSVRALLYTKRPVLT